MAVDRERRLLKQVRGAVSDPLFWMTAFLLTGAFLLVFRLSVRVVRRNYFDTFVLGFQRPDLMSFGVALFLLVYLGVWIKFANEPAE